MPCSISLKLTNSLHQCSFHHLKQIHAFILTTTLITNIQISSNFLRRATEFGAMDYPQLIFSQLDHIFPPHILLWNTMIRGYAFNGPAEKCLKMFDEMPLRGVVHDSYTYPYVLNSCFSARLFSKGKNVHAQIVKCGFESSFEVANALLDFYIKKGVDELGDARKVFDRMSVRPVRLWNKMIYLYVNADHIEPARELFDLMPERDVVSWNSMVSGYARAGDFVNARDLFEAIPEKNVVSWTTMMGVYARMGDLETVKKFFEEIPCKNVVSWNSMISSYNKYGRFQEAMNLFLRMRLESGEFDGFTIVSVLAACANIGDLGFGKCIHSLIQDWSKLGVIVGTALIEMYAKCGDIDKAFTIFTKLGNKDVFSWNVMIKALAIHGRSKDAIKLFHNMQKMELQANEFTISSALFACSHGGLVEEGRKIFYGMERDFKVCPKIDHFGCFVDLLSRNGQLEEAELVTKEMPMKPDVAMWGAMLHGCRVRGDFKLAEKVIKQVTELTDIEPGVHALLSNMYASTNQWPNASAARKKIDDKNATKIAGYSSVI